WMPKDGDSTLEGQALPVKAGYTATTATKNGAVVTPQSTTEAVIVNETATDITEVVIYSPDAKAPQLAVIKYEDEAGNLVPSSALDGESPVDTEVGSEGEDITYSTASKIEKLKKHGYELVTDGFTTADGRKFDNTPDEPGKDPSQVFKVTVRPQMSTVTPDPNNPSNPTPKDPNNPDNPRTPVVPGQPIDPNNPDGPKWPNPGKPIDPNNPDGPKWPEDKGVSEKDLIKKVTRTINYVYEDGSEAAETRTETVTFTRTATVNHATGEVTYSAWTVSDKVDADKNHDGKWNEEASPVITGYVTDTAVVAEETPSVETADKTVTVTYKKLGNWIPKIPDGATPVDPTPTDGKDPKEPIPYPNDPKDPTKPETPTKDTPTPIPYVPGYTPEDPNGNPLKPVDPNNPEKGYIPPVPTNPTEDIEISYAKDPEPQPEPKPEPQPEPKPEPQPEPKPEPQPEPKPEPQPEPKPEPQPEPKPEPQPEPKPEPQPEPKPEPQPEPKPTPQLDQSTDPAKAELPNTGDTVDNAAFAYGVTALGFAALLGLSKKKSEEE
ncbi:LPXTG cell wall anchor domain-containing protein, partial [Streptococcus sp. ZJ93]|uniref:mucin-binding protein n=1 Tax=Streptococcus handemini TaxID=3161188 RepID=UPI0034D41C7C